MKKILILLAVVGLTFTSCYQDEYEAPTGGETVKKAYFATAENTTAMSATPYDIVVDFTAAFANDVLLSYTLDGTPMQMTINAGATSAVLASVDVSTSGAAHTAVINAIASNGDAVAVDMDRKTTSVIVPYDANPGNVRFILQWDGGSAYDLDFRIRRDNSSDTFSNTVDSATGYTNPEICDFPEASEADGTYYIKLNEYSTISSLNYTIIAVEPDGTNHAFSSVLEDGLGYHYVMEFTKTTDTITGDISYTYLMY